jgi:Kip1 ubiquitination-promoting complex protein 1
LLEIEAQSNWVSIRANTAVFADRYYYEVQILTPGVMQIGWCTLQTQFSQHEGVGDSECSYAFDGYRRVKWNQGQQAYGQRWVTGDVIGTMIDLDKGTIRYWRNGQPLGVAFSNVKSGPNMAYFPAISMQKQERCIFNFGLRPFCATDLPFEACAINEP